LGVGLGEQLLLLVLAVLADGSGEGVLVKSGKTALQHGGILELSEPLEAAFTGIGVKRLGQ
jgi:hypothetical protein